MTDLLAPPPRPAKPADPGRPAGTTGWRPLPGGRGQYLHHECARCGAVPAPYGEKVSLRKEQLGTWWCRPCWQARVHGGEP